MKYIKRYQKTTQRITLSCNSSEKYLKFPHFFRCIKFVVKSKMAAISAIIVDDVTDPQQRRYLKYLRCLLKQNINYLLITTYHLYLLEHNTNYLLEIKYCNTEKTERRGCNHLPPLPPPLPPPPFIPCLRYRFACTSEG